MELIKPKQEVKKLELQLGDILYDSNVGTYMLRETRDRKYMFRPLSGIDGGYNGVHDTLESIAERTQKNLKDHANDIGRTIVLYKANEWDLKLVPKGSS